MMLNWEIIETSGSKSFSERTYECPVCHNIESRHKYEIYKKCECPVCHAKLKYPFEKITNKEWLMSTSNEEIAKWLTIHMPPCDYCEIVEDCLPEMYPDCQGTVEAWLRWLEDIHNESI